MTESKQKRKNKKKLILLLCIVGIFLVLLLSFQASAIKSSPTQSQITFVTIDEGCVNITPEYYNEPLREGYNITLLNHTTHEEALSFTSTLRLLYLPPIEKILFGRPKNQ